MKFITAMRIVLFTSKLIYVSSSISSDSNERKSLERSNSQKRGFTRSKRFILNEDHFSVLGNSDSPDDFKHLEIEDSDEKDSLEHNYQDVSIEDEDETYVKIDLKNGKVDTDPIIEFNIELASGSARQKPKLSKYVDKVKFKLWSMSNENSILLQETTLDNEHLFKNYWLKNVPLKVIIHGWQITKSMMDTDKYVFKIKRAYLKETNKYNVMTVDWSEFSALYNYFSSAKKCAVVGIIVGQFLNNLVKIEIEKADNIHIIGHSLGAHVSGYAGKSFARNNKKKIQRITGLDPAGAGFEIAYLTGVWYKALNPGDAEFVDVIYTSIGNLGLGINTVVGDANFYPNGGTSPQPGCNKFYPFECSHARAYKLYSESISRNQAFEAVECSSLKDFKKGNCKNNPKTHMGHHADPSKRGKFYLVTNGKGPYIIVNA